MSEVAQSDTTSWTAADLVHRFGAIPIARVRSDPAPGTATEDDVVRIHDRENRLYELVDGALLEKTVGTYESYLAMAIARLLANFIVEHDLGMVLGADGMVRLAPGLVRIPDISFISWARLPDRRIPNQAIADLVPDLAVEIISRGNTREEMERKLREYFQAGVRLVWYVYPEPREVHVYTAVERVLVITVEQSLDGRDVLPGLVIALSELFEPGR
ncbi:MAG: Uma2 family endonuclease [Planctomycetes bacterium]|nr:Uma2 family endonuclease [Planctomycetota bacterium]